MWQSRVQLSVGRKITRKIKNKKKIKCIYKKKKITYVYKSKIDIHTLFYKKRNNNNNKELLVHFTWTI